MEFRATPDAVPGARRHATACAENAGANPETTERVALAVTEAVTNVVFHAYTESNGDNPVELEVLVDDAQLVVYVRDQGRGLIPRPDSPGLGCGLPLIIRVADRVKLSSVNGHGTEVCMRFRLPARL